MEVNQNFCVFLCPRQALQDSNQELSTAQSGLSVLLVKWFLEFQEVALLYFRKNIKFLFCVVILAWILTSRRYFKKLNYSPFTHTATYTLTATSSLSLISFSLFFYSDEFHKSWENDQSIPSKSTTFTFQSIKKWLFYCNISIIINHCLFIKSVWWMAINDQDIFIYSYFCCSYWIGNNEKWFLRFSYIWWKSSL